MCGSHRDLFVWFMPNQPTAKQGLTKVTAPMNSDEKIRENMDKNKISNPSLGKSGFFSPTLHTSLLTGAINQGQGLAIFRVIAM